MSPLLPPPGYLRIKKVPSFAELIGARFADGINAFCWERTLPGDFEEVVTLLGTGSGIMAVDEDQLTNLPASPGGRAAIDILLEDLHLLREADRDPQLNRIDHYPRDKNAGPIATDVLSYHADRAPVEADTWLCTYHGAPSEGLRNDEAQKKVDIPGIRAELLRSFGGEDDEGFREYLSEISYDLHYAPQPGSQPFSFGVGHLWRIAVDWPGSAVPPCIHRAPDTKPGDPPRLLLIS